MKNTIRSWKKLWSDLGTRRWIFLFFVGVLLVVIAVPVGEGADHGQIDRTETKETNESGIPSAYHLQDSHNVQTMANIYEAEVEARLTMFLKQIEGAGEVKVMVTVSRSSELILQRDTSREESIIQETDSQGGTRDNSQRREDSQTVLTGGSGGSQPYVVGEIMPQVEGVVVACEGGNRPTVQAEISAAVQALFDLEPHKIKVCKMASP